MGLNDGSCGPDSVHVSVVVRRMYYWDSESTQDEDFIDAVSVVVRRMYYWDTSLFVRMSKAPSGFSSC